GAALPRAGVPVAADPLRADGLRADRASPGRRSEDDVAGVRPSAARDTRVPVLDEGRIVVMRLAFADLRDGLVLVDFPDASDDAANRAAVALARSLEALSARGLYDAIPAQRTLLLSFGHVRLPHRSAVRAVARARPAAAPLAARWPTAEIPAAFDGEDLGGVAAAAGLTSRAFVEAYVAAEYRVAFLGFSPGFPYMTGLPEGLR